MKPADIAFVAFAVVVFVWLVVGLIFAVVLYRERRFLPLERAQALQSEQAAGYRRGVLDEREAIAASFNMGPSGGPWTDEEVARRILGRPPP